MSADMSKKPDWPKMGPSLLIAACPVSSVRTAKWPPRGGGGTTSDRDLDVETEHAIPQAGRVLSSLVSRHGRYSHPRKSHGSFRMARNTPK